MGNLWRRYPQNQSFMLRVVKYQITMDIGNTQSYVAGAIGDLLTLSVVALVRERCPEVFDWDEP